MTGELLLELLCEEIPARMQRAAIDDLCALLRGKLADAEIPALRMQGYVTPRRLAVVAAGIPASQPDRREERRGPRLGAPQAAIDGFLRATGRAALADCEIRATPRGEFYFAIVEHSGRATAEVLPEVIRAAMAELPWPKAMRFPAAPIRWVRPLTAILCLFDGAIVPLALGRVPVGRVTRGHRFLAPGEITVHNAAEYLERLEQAHVVLDHERRKAQIRDDLDRLAAAAGIRVKPDPLLLDEVAGLVEFPVTLIGAIDPAFMSLPPEVLTASMRAHQKYFSCVHPDGSAAPHFLFVANMLAADGGAAIIAGNERVLRARLADARFFWEQDRKIRLEDRVGALKERIYHENLGSVLGKVKRIRLLAEFLASHVKGADSGRAGNAAWFAKADLATGMVGEFPELQGIIGSYYYREEHASEGLEAIQIAVAIGDHYKPLGPGDRCPHAPDSIVVALSDKIDTLVAFFAISLPPTGSRDPFALRRAALGIIRIILENHVRLPLKAALTAAAEIFYRQRKVPNWEERVPPLYAELIEFIIDRLKVHLREQSVRHDLIAAAFAQVGTAEDDLVRLLARVEALRVFIASEDGANLLVAYRRAANIVAIEERRDGRRHDRPVDPALLQQAEERTLYDRLSEVSREAGTSLAREEFAEGMATLARLRRPVDSFFDKVTVNCDDPKLRENRLHLLSAIRAVMNQVADFSQIEG